MFANIKMALYEHYGQKRLTYNSYPPYPELRCDRCFACTRHSKEDVPMQAGQSYKDGKPYNCDCDLLSSPYSFAFESFVDPNQHVCPMNAQIYVPSQEPSMDVGGFLGAMKMKKDFDMCRWAILLLLVIYFMRLV